MEPLVWKVQEPSKFYSDNKLFCTLVLTVQGASLVAQPFSSTDTPDTHVLDFVPWGRNTFIYLISVFKQELAEVPLGEDVLESE